MAFQVYGMLANGMGGLDWSHLAYAAAYYGADDLDDLTARLMVIKLHKPKKPGEE